MTRRIIQQVKKRKNNDTELYISQLALNRGPNIMAWTLLRCKFLSDSFVKLFNVTSAKCCGKLILTNTPKLFTCVTYVITFHFQRPAARETGKWERNRGFIKMGLGQMAVYSLKGLLRCFTWNLFLLLAFLACSRSFVDAHTDYAKPFFQLYLCHANCWNCLYNGNNNFILFLMAYFFVKLMSTSLKFSETNKQPWSV